MQGTFHIKRNRKGAGHGAQRHKNASGNKLVLWHLANFHNRWRPEPLKMKAQKREWKRLKHERNRRKQ